MRSNIGTWAGTRSLFGILATILASVCFVGTAHGDATANISPNVPAATTTTEIRTLPFGPSDVHDRAAAEALNSALLQATPQQAAALLAIQSPSTVNDLVMMAQVAFVERTIAPVPLPPLPDLPTPGGGASPSGIHCESAQTTTVGKSMFGTRLWSYSVYADSCFNLGATTFYLANFNRWGNPEFYGWQFMGHDAENRSGGVGSSSFHEGSYGTFKFCADEAFPPIVKTFTGIVFSCSYERPGSEVTGNIYQPGDNLEIIWQCWYGNRCEGYTYGVLRWSTG